MKQTMLERYGVEFKMQTEEAKEHYKKVMLERYGVVNGFLLGDKNRVNRISKINKTWGNLLGVEEKDYEFVLKGKFFDLKKDKNLIEINPSITHNNTYGVPWVKNSFPLEIDYHFDKTKLGIENGYRVIHVWDWDDKDKICYLFNNKQVIYARKCILKEVIKKDCDMFLNKYHLQNTCRGQDICYGLYYNDELVSLMTFGKPRYNKNYDWELLRYCTHKDYKIAGGAEKLFKCFIKNNKGSIVSYCDNSKFSGGVYQKLGFILKDYGCPNKHWYNIKTKTHIYNSLLLKLGFDKLFKTNYGKGTSNEQLMLEHGFVEIYDCGQSLYEYKPE